MKNNPLEKFTTKELEDELGRRKNVSKDLELTLWSETAISPNGVRPKDLIVIANVHEVDGETRFNLALKKRWAKKKFITDEYEEYSDWYSILPGNFGECMENCYEWSRGNDPSLEPIALLKRCGFTVIEYDWETRIEKAL